VLIGVVEEQELVDALRHGAVGDTHDGGGPGARLHQLERRQHLARRARAPDHEDPVVAAARPPFRRVRGVRQAQAGLLSEHGDRLRDERAGATA